MIDLTAVIKYKARYLIFHLCRVNFFEKEAEDYSSGFLFYGPNDDRVFFTDKCEGDLYWIKSNNYYLNEYESLEGALAIFPNAILINRDNEKPKDFYSYRETDLTL